MSEKFNIIKEGSDSFLTWAIIHMVSAMPQDEQDRLHANHVPQTDFELHLTIDGRELSMRALIARLKEVFDEQVDRRAEALIRERLSDRMRPVEDLLFQFQTDLTALIEGRKLEDR